MVPRLRELSLAKKTEASLTTAVAVENVWITCHLEHSLPRSLRAHDVRPPQIIFTDAASEDSDREATVGAVCFDRLKAGAGCEVSFFGEQIRRPLIDVLQAH